MWLVGQVFRVLLALLPSLLKIPLYRVFLRYEIGQHVRIGFSPLFGVAHCRIGDHVRIGHFNLFYGVGELEIGDHVRIGFLNLFRGGRKIRIGAYATILRQNVFNAIIEQDFLEEVDSALDLGLGVVVTTGHWLDFSASMQIGEHSIVGGRHSSFWTHNRQRGRAIKVGAHCYLGSEVRAAPGVELAPFCVVALGSVLNGRFDVPRTLIGGNPASVLRSLQDRDLFLVARKTRNDIPDELAVAPLPDDLRAILRRFEGVVVEHECADVPSARPS